MPKRQSDLTKLLNLAARLGVEPYRHYSGRMMFGVECIGLRIADYGDVDEHDVARAARRLGIRGERTDSLGRSSLLMYWPSVADPYVPENLAASH